MFDIYAAVTDRIIAQMENGIIPWHKSWTGSNKAISHTTGKPYSLMNQMLLGRPGEYITFAECQKESGKVKKGEKGHMVVFWKPLDKKDDQGNPIIGPDGDTEKLFFLKYYTVFHIDQCEGITAKYAEAAPENPAEPDAAADAIITGYVNRSGITFRHEEGGRAFYQPSTDTVVLPFREQFTETAEYYSAAFHELTHSTGHPTRLNRITSPAFFGSEDYSKEELVAEIGASALVNFAGIETDSSFRNNVAYLQNWLQVLKNDKRFIVSAAGKAEKAVNLIIG